MTKPVNTEAIEKTTGQGWEEWLVYLQSIDAKDLSHKQIADHVRGKLKDTLENAGWWAQSITVAYEQHIGRREPGQRSDGTFEVAISKTMAGSMEDVMQAWVTLIADHQEFNNTPVAKQPTVSQTARNHHWGCNLADGTRVNVDVYAKSPEKCGFTITHIKLANQNAQEEWRNYWKDLISSL
jgi:hypothetical protein